ncbi:glycosyltransferase family 4 protein [Nodosilinea nodulosa]|uniref:glycosyltransferase family 4 protein n=1 Tax=Nodosilinea nodulosa TaxID=416001 RepID=UPI000308909B|nr:glycosyltransferase family 1 protein [Nodosilinea nodulosa]
MHILIPILHRPEKPTGVCRHGANLAQCLAERDEVSRVTVLIGSWQVDYFANSFDLDSPKIKLIDIDIKNSSVSRNVWFLNELPRLANRLQPDVVHLSFPFPIVRRWFKAPLVATIHDLYPYECPQNFGYPQVWFNQWFLRQCVGQCQGLSCVSQVTLDALKAYFPTLQRRKPLRVIYNSVEFGAGEAAVPAQLAQDLGKPFLLGVAQHRKNKNLDLLIRAYAQLSQAQRLTPGAQLCLVGSSGPETEALHQLVQALGVQGQVRFLSGLSDGELRWLYEHAEVFVMPSSTEGFCLPLVEAQTLGCPIVCSDIAIFHEIASPHCRYFSLTEAPLSNLVQAMENALTQPAPRDSYINPAFLKKTVAQQYLNLYGVVRSKLQI